METMKITVISVGKIKENYLNDGINEFKKRLSRYCTLDLIQVADEKCPETLSKSEKETIKNREGDKILSKIKENSFIITLEINGKMLSSEELASFIQKKMTTGSSHFTFIIGGSLGLSDNVKKKASLNLSFSKMTFPHQMMKMILLEQVYRAFRIIKNEPYHK